MLLDRALVNCRRIISTRDREVDMIMHALFNQNSNWVKELTLKIPATLQRENMIALIFTFWTRFGIYRDDALATFWTRFGLYRDDALATSNIDSGHILDGVRSKLYAHTHTHIPSKALTLK